MHFFVCLIDLDLKKLWKIENQTPRYYWKPMSVLFVNQIMNRALANKLRRNSTFPGTYKRARQSEQRDFG